MKGWVSLFRNTFLLGWNKLIQTDQANRLDALQDHLNRSVEKANQKLFFRLHVCAKNLTENPTFYVILRLMCNIQKSENK